MSSSAAADRAKPLIPPKAKQAAPFKASATPSWGLMLNPIAWLLWTLDFLVWLLTIVGPINTLSYYMKGKYSVETSTGCRRNPAAVGGLSTTAIKGKEIYTIADFLDEITAKYGDVPVMGTRTFLGEHKVEGAKFPLKKFGETKWITYVELKARALAFGAALVSDKIGLVPIPKGADLEKSTESHSILLFEDTSAEWMTAALGAMSYSIAVATSYATLGIGAVAEAINDSSVKVLVTNHKQVGKLGVLAAKCPSLSTIVYTEVMCSPEDTAGPAPTFSGSSVGLLAFEDLISLGQNLGSAGKAPVRPDGKTIAMIMYTSGSTGKPKGVMMKHESICSSIGGLTTLLASLGNESFGKCYLAYLPQAHILEFCAELTCLARGAKLGYADPRTLSSTGACRQRPDGTVNATAGYPYPPGAIQEFAPAYMAGVPKIWDILKKAFEDQIAKTSPVKRMLFQIAFVGRAAALRQHREAPLLKALVFKKIAKMLGGNLEATISGGGAISSEVQTFVRTCFVAPCVQGYALTETTCSATIQLPDASHEDGVVGGPLTSVEVRLVSCAITDKAGVPYSATDKVHLGKPCAGRGEIQIKGPTVASGYYKMPEQTTEVFHDDGWFSTGDVGIWRPDGQLQIVDRVKNLIKAKGGEYVAIESMEKEYSTCAYVSGVNGGILCYCDGDMDRPVAFVVCDEKKLTNWADANGIAYDSFPQLCATPEANKEVLGALVAAGKSGKLSPNEHIVGVCLLPGTGPPNNQPPKFNDPWTPENGMLTASNKLQRKQILATYGANGVFEETKNKGIK